MDVTIFEVGSSKMRIITVVAKQGYHQISVRECDIDIKKLTFFAPDNRKYNFKVMPFGPVNAPDVYTCMMGNFREKWDILFL